MIKPTISGGKLLIELLAPAADVPAGAARNAGLAYNAAGALYCSPDAPVGTRGVGGVLTTAGGAVHVADVGTIDEYNAGLPMTATGALVIDTVAAVSVTYMFPFTADGRIAATV